MEYNSDTWKVVDNYFNVHDNYLTKHHLDSFNDFVLNKIPLTIKQYNPQKLYKELNKETNIFKYETHIYYGGKDGNSIYIGRPIIFKDIDETQMKKTLYPNEARLRNLTYASYIFCDVHVEYIIRSESSDDIIITKEFKQVNLGQIPIMLQSKICMLFGASFDLRKSMGECPYDQGGYFVVEGQEKVIVSHERKTENKLYIVNSLEGLYSYSAQIKSIPDDSFKYARTTVVNINKSSNVITIRLPSIKKQIPLFIIFRALGIESDKEILEYILYDLDDTKANLFMEDLRYSIEDVGPIYNQDVALKYLANLTIGNSMSHLKSIITTDIFPHVGTSYINKAYYLGYVVHKLLNVVHNIDSVTDRDSFEYKRVDLSGFLLANMFRESFKQFQRDTKIAIDSEYRFNSSQYQDSNYQNIINSDNIKKIFNQNVITNLFNKSFKIGTILNKKGLIQSLNRLTYVGTISHLRRINTYGDMIMIGQRKLHPTQYGIICPVETPDGGNIGIKKHLTVTGHITFGCDPQPIIDLLLQLGTRTLENIRPTHTINNCKVFVNGKWIGIHTDPIKLVHILKLFRQNSYINIFTSIVFNYRTLDLSILTDGGRCCRPLYIMDDNKLLINNTHINKLSSGDIDWYNLVGGFHTKKTDYYECDYNCPIDIDFANYDKIIEELTKTRSVIEFLDTDEMAQVLLCTNYNKLKENDRFSHCEIHPSLIMGILGFTIPYVNTSQAPRNVYGTGQTKQAVGVYTSNYRNRFDISAHLLHYGQKPLITTRLSKYSFIDKLPTGINTIVAIASYSGYNQDDSIIINKSSMERGLFASSYFKTYEDKEIIDTRNNSQDFFYDPNDDINSDVKTRNQYNYNSVNENGLVNEGSYVNDGDILISKYTKVGSGSSAIMADNSVPVKMDGWGVVDKVFSDYYNSDKQKIARVRICTYRNPSLGDKFASRHGQKGVIGMILPQEDMPFTKDGIVPDIIINPHAIPSRMTIGQLIECVMGKACCMLGTYADATPFTNIDNNEIYNILETNCNFQKHGDEVLYSGINGKQLSSKIFIGPTYYQRLKHMVKDKINSRASGAVSLKTKQPPSGRAVGGGLRIGEMERDAILSHGTLQFLKETMIERSDKYSTNISTYSGMTSIVNTNDNKFVCPSVDGPLTFNDELNLQNDNSSCDIVKVNIPYNTHLMMQECNAMGISMRLIIDKESKYEKIDNPNKPEKFVLQDGDKRKMIMSKKESTQKKFIPKTKKNKETFINNMINNKVMVTNIAESVSRKDIMTLFESVGKIFELRTQDNSFKVIYTSEDDAKKSILELNNVLLDGQRIMVSLASDDMASNYVEPLNIYGSPAGVGWQGAGEIPIFDPNEFPGVVPTSPLEPYVPHSPAYVAPPSPEYVAQSPPLEGPADPLAPSKWWFENDEYNIADYPNPVGVEEQKSYEYPTDGYSPTDFNKPNPYGRNDYIDNPPYTPNTSFMNDLNQKEAAIKAKYKAIKDAAIKDPSKQGGGFLEDPNLNKLLQPQSGGGPKLDFSDINLGSDNLLSTTTLGGHNVNDLTTFNDGGDDIKNITISAPSNLAQNSNDDGLINDPTLDLSNELQDNFNDHNIVPYDYNEILGDVPINSQPTLDLQNTSNDTSYDNVNISITNTPNTSNTTQSSPNITEPSFDITENLIDNLDISVLPDLNEITL